MISVAVGTPATLFVVHKDLICTNSPFFKAACSSWWPRPKGQPIKLPDHKPRTFQLYCDWLYSPSSSLRAAAEAVDGLPDSNSMAVMGDDHGTTICTRLCYLWILADYLNDTGCKNEVINSLLRGLHGNIASARTRVFPIVYQTRETSALRRWLIDCVVPFISPTNIRSETETFTAEMLRDILTAYAAAQSMLPAARAPDIGQALRYHE